MAKKHSDVVAERHQDSRECAVGLVEHLRAGGELMPSRARTVNLDIGEVEYAQLEAFGARWFGLDQAVWESRTFIAGGMLMAALTATASAVGNAARKRAARAEAAAQWRPLGWMPVVVTSHRLVVFHEGVWQSVWYSAVRQVIPEPGGDGLQILFERDDPYRLTGAHVPFLAVVLVHLLYGEVFDLAPSLEPAAR